MSSTCFEPEGSSSGRRLYIQVWYRTFYMHQYRIVCSNTHLHLKDCLYWCM